MNNVRDLTTNDLDSIMNIIENKNQITRIKIKNYDLSFFKNQILKFLEPYPNKEFGRVIGYFENGDLISFLTQQFTSIGPMWYMTMLATKSPHTWNWQLNGLDRCWEYTMARAERNNIYRFIWSMPAAWSRTQRRTLKTSNFLPRYNIYYDCIIPAGEFPIWPEHKSVFGELVKDHDVLIKSAILKNEYRPNDIRSQM